MPKYDNYARVGTHNDIQVRGSIRDPWPQCGWDLGHARSYAAFIIELCDKAEREDPKVKELMKDLKAIEIAGTGLPFWEEFAIQLTRKGYHK